MKPGTLIEFLAENIVRIHLSHPLRIAVDGVDASGKTYFADALALMGFITQNQSAGSGGTFPRKAFITIHSTIQP